MKIKQIDDFTLNECKDYLDSDSCDELNQQVTERMEYLQQAREQESESMVIYDEFCVEFNRCFATKRYAEAYAICLKYVTVVDCKDKIIEKANIAIHQLKNYIQLPSSISISYNWLIDQLILYGYSNMKYDEPKLQWKFTTIILSIDNNSTNIISRCRFSIFQRIAIFLTLIVLICAPIYAISNEFGAEEFGSFICGVLFCIFIMLYKKFAFQHEYVLRKLAKIIIFNMLK